MPNKKRRYFQLATEIEDFYAPYEFKPSDKIQLSITGNNLLSQLKKEQHILDMAEKSLVVAEESLKESKKSAKYAKYAIYISITSILIALAQIFLG